MADRAAAVSQLVIIGSSAGGIDALSAVARTLPPEMPAPILIAQHLDPRRPSHLTEILRRHTSLRVETVEDRAPLEASTIFVMPPGRHAEITDHEIRLVDVGHRGPRPSIDLLFSSAAQVFGEGLIAVILTGTGHDGAAGARDVKSLGGTVVIQNPDTASYPGMPLALAPTSIDIVAELDTIGPLLHDLATGVHEPSRPDEERLLRGFLDQLRDRSGIDFGSYKRATILRRLQRRMVATGQTKLRDYIRHVQANPDEYQRLTASFLIKVTEFFRDTDLFDQLRDTVIPQLIAEARERDNELRVWSAGCATGEEAYSLAILVADALGDELDAFNVRIFATDVDGDAITFARHGVYAEQTLAGLPHDLVGRHFTKVADGYEVKKRIRAITVFGQHDLGQRAPFPRVDLALCRNVLIYFTTELQKRALQLFAFSLRDGGFLVLGKAESATPPAGILRPRPSAVEDLPATGRPRPDPADPDPGYRAGHPGASERRQASRLDRRDARESTRDAARTERRREGGESPPSIAGRGRRRRSGLRHPVDQRHGSATSRDPRGGDRQRSRPPRAPSRFRDRAHRDRRGVPWRRGRGHRIGPDGGGRRRGGPVDPAERSSPQCRSERDERVRDPDRHGCHQ
ncbi:MAG TPA: CheR family methyltransferase [Candidatus Limnocylindrales bacterium]|nr:CheR family methyltransferase [Candidatus Limnocylindrales bacterium]